MTIVCLSYSKTGFDTVLACLGGKVYQWWRGVVNFCRRNGGLQFFECDFLYIWDPPLLKKMPAPLKQIIQGTQNGNEVSVGLGTFLNQNSQNTVLVIFIDIPSE